MATQVTLNSGAVSSAGSLKLQTNGTTDAVTIDTAQNIGLGVTPSAWSNSWKVIESTNGGALYFNSSQTSLSSNAFNDGTGWKYKTTAPAGLYNNVQGVHYWYTAPSGTAGTAISLTQAMTLENSGNLAIGQTSALDSFTRLTVAGNGAYCALNTTTTGYTLVRGYDNGTQRWAVGQNGFGGADGLAFYTGSSTTERARIDSSGNLLVGTTSALLANAHAFVASGNSTFALRYSGATAGRYWKVGPDTSNNFVVFNQGDTGMYMVYGATSWTANSDERLKTVLTPFENAAAKVATLRAGTGRYLTDDEGVSRSFLIAQDVQAVLPEAVDVQPDEQGTLGLRYQDTIPLLVAAIQEQQAIIQQLQADVAALKG